MRNEKEIMYDLIRKQKSCEFSLRFFLQRENGGLKIILVMLKLVKKGTRDEVNYDYGNYVLGEKLLTIQEGLRTISSLYQADDEKRILKIPNYGEFAISSKGRLDFISSKQKYGYLIDEWPKRFCEFQVHQSQKGSSGYGELVKEGCPYYPRVIEAAIHFFELAVEHFSSFGVIFLAVIDYRARIESLKLIFSKAELKLNSPEIKHKDLVIKVFAKSGGRMVTLPDMYPTSESIKFDVGFQPDNLSVVLLSRQDNLKVDGKEFAKWREEGEGVFVERPEEEILSLTRVGEGQDVEYKQHVDDDSKKNDFIETVVAFLNTNRGIILLGVSDGGSVIGTQKDVEDIRKLIHDNCDPPPRDVRVEEKKILGERVVVVEIPEGDARPYQSKRDKNFYVRHDASDMRMERSELLSILKEQTE